jgi:hypothetical protein
MRGLVSAQSKPRLLPIHHQQAIRTLHPLPVIFIRSPTNETDLTFTRIEVGRGYQNSSEVSKVAEVPAGLPESQFGL